MKFKTYLYQIIAVGILLFGSQACFQDLGQDPPFNFPEHVDLFGKHGESLYLPFEGTFNDTVTGTKPGLVGNPIFVTGKIGKAYKGVPESYLTFPTNLVAPKKEFSATFWYKLNTSKERAGILVISPADPKDASANVMTSGIRLFREGPRTLKLNVGNGAGDNWFDGAANAALPIDEWAFVAITISETTCTVYINGNVVSTGAFSGISWNGASLISIGSGAPRFVGWGHLSDESLIDELRLFKKALTEAEVKALMNL